MAELPVVVIGAGPQGLAAAARLLERGIEPLVLERGTTAGAAVGEWGDVRMFSEWPELVDGPARRLLEAVGHEIPAAGYPTGAEWTADYLIPLASALGVRVRTGATVTGVARSGRDRLVDAGRAEAPFEVRITNADGSEERITARAVLDASGTWPQPNPAGAAGLPALGERGAAAEGLIGYRIPTATEADDLAGKHIAVIGSGHSASHAVIRLAALAERAPGTRVEWLIRRGAPSGLSSANDQLPARGALGGRASQAVESGAVELVRGFRTAAFERTGGTLTVVGEDATRITDVDHVIALTGFRPDTGFLSELRTALDPSLEAVAGLAEQIDPNRHSCGTVRASGVLELAQPEPDFYIVGAKSYGRAPTFLALTGYEQVRSVVAELAGDHSAALRNELVLPESGVCGGAGDFGDASCCSPAAKQPLTLGLRPDTVDA
ncbi:MAG: NAD(P)-binding domain-containing protein [Microbacteriaceae bacterium]|nr:NAD(P)-binding domain-containing protein [Microbacteriaceae bacterium]MCL2794642.1 NAD(P)-binding domain-containing protein [Microbacteriaceae bacterium]